MPLHHANLGLALMLRNDQGDVEAALHHWQLMHRYGDIRLRRAFQQAMEAGSPEAVSKLQFQDVELVFLPIQLKHWIMLIPPRMTGPRYVLQEVVDLPEWHLQAHDPLIRRSLSYRQRALRQRELLQRLVV